MNRRIVYALRKRANTAGDALRGCGGSILGMPISGGLTAAAGTVGRYSGMLRGFQNESKDQIVDALTEMEDAPNKYLGLVPGIGTYRVYSREQLMKKLLENKKNKNATTPASRAGARVLSFLNPLNWLAYLPASLAAGATDTDSLKEVADTVNDPNYTLKSFLIPGWNTYKGWKALGASDTISDMQYTEEDLKDLDENTRKVLASKLKSKKAVKK